MRKGLFVAAACTAVSLLAACAHVPAVPAASRYVAMGSSFAAGPMLGMAKAGAPVRCGRTESNYPTLVARWLGSELVDVTCSGAKTTHILGKWDELAPQIDAVTADTRLVTVTIGGNDVNYVGNLMAASCQPGGTRPCPELRLPTPQDWGTLGANLREIAREVHARAPQAQLVFVDYVTLVPETANCAAVPLSDENRKMLRGLGQRLASVTEEAAKDGNATLVKAGEMSRNHTACDPQPWSKGASGSEPGVPWHPSAAGMQAIANAVAGKIIR